MLGGLAGSLGRVAEFAAGGLLAGGISQLGQMGGAAIQAGMDFNALKERSQIAFETMLGSGEKATTFLNDLQAFAAKTPFEFPDLIKGSQRLLAMGFAAEDVLPTMTAVGDAVAGLGGGAAQVDSVTRALGQMKAKGKASAQEMMQLTEAGIPAWEFLAKAAGMSVAEVQDAVSKGAISADEAIDGILAGMQGKFGGMMEKQSTSFDGMLSTLKDNATQAAATITKPLFDLAKEGMSGLNAMFASADVQAGLQQFAENLAEGMRAIGGFLNTQVLPALAQFGNFLQTNVLPPLMAFGGFLQANILPVLAQFAAWLGGTILTAVQQFAGWLTEQLVPALGLMIDKIATAAMPALVALGGWLNTTGIPAVQKLANFLGPIISGALGVIGTLITTVLIPAFTAFAVFLFERGLPALGELANVLGGKLNGLVEFFAKTWATINLAWQSAITFLGDLHEGLENAANLLEQRVGPMFQWFITSVIQPFRESLAGLAGYLAKIIAMLQKAAALMSGGGFPTGGGGEGGATESGRLFENARVRTRGETFARTRNASTLFASRTPLGEVDGTIVIELMLDNRAMQKIALKTSEIMARKARVKVAYGA